MVLNAPLPRQDDSARTNGPNRPPPSGVLRYRAFLLV